MFKKLLTLLITLFAITACNKKSEKTIGILQAIDHPALNQTRDGILQSLKESGITPENSTIFIESAQGNSAVASQIAQKFVGSECDIIITIGTMPSQAALQAATSSNTPVIFASVTDPKGAKLTTGNISGVSNYIDPSTQFAFFKRLLPHLKTLGIVFNPGEPNSVSLNASMEKEAQKIEWKLSESPASKTSDVYSATVNITSKVDAIFINNDNTAHAAIASLIKGVNESKKPVFSSDTDSVEKGALAALGPNQFQIGCDAGKMAIKVLEMPKGQKDASKLPIQYPRASEIYLNAKAAKDLGIVFSEDLVKEAKKILE
jgi:putative ABC transport system substrate-binding protein